MKRLLPLIPVLLFLLISSCDVINAVSPAEGTAVGETQTAIIWTPTVTPLPDPDESKIIEWLNTIFSELDPLERTLDAKYQVVDVLFDGMPSNANAVFRMDIRCECAANTQCCVPERMFVVTIAAMKNINGKIIEQVADRANDVQVVCYDHAVPIGMMIAPWSDVKGYLLGEITGYQLGARVVKLPVP